MYLLDYHRSRSKLGRFGKIVGIDAEGGEYLVMLQLRVPGRVDAPQRVVQGRYAVTPPAG